MATWIYNNTKYTSQADLDAAVTALKSRLDNNPTDWVTVKEVTSDGNGGWVIPSDTLTDAEINAMVSDKYYSVSAVHSGFNEVGMSGTNATAKVSELRTEYAQWIDADVVVKMYAPTNEDMSGYV